MNWNHRVVEEEGILSIREVYYDGEDVNGWTENAIGVVGENEEELRQTLQWMLAALDKPILVSEGFEFKGFTV